MKDDRQAMLLGFGSVQACVLIASPIPHVCEETQHEERTLVGSDRTMLRRVYFATMDSKTRITDQGRW